MERVEKGTHLVDQVGSTMNEVVVSIGRVTDIMGEISAASAEQSSGVSQVGQAVMQMDQGFDWRTLREGQVLIHLWPISDLYT